MAPKAPSRFRIPVHLFALSIGSAPAIIYALYWKRNHSTDEEFEEKLKKNYSSEIQGSRNKKDEMVKFFQAMKNPNSNPEHDQKLQEVLRGGKGEMKRHYAVDDKLYGTEEGVQKRKEAEEQQQEQQKLKKKKKDKKKKRKHQDGGDDENNEKQKMKNVNDDDESLQMQNSPIMLPSVKQATATAVGIGALTLVVSLLSGRKNS